MTTITARSILASRHAVTGDEVHTLLLHYPRCIHSEFMTHRMLSRNSASSRAIPVEKMIQSILDDPFVPLHWGKNQKGMQADEECDALVWNDKHTGSWSREGAWLSAMEIAVKWARRFNESGYHKQIVNRLLEPWMHIIVVATGMKKGAWSNFLALRDHEAAEPHIQILAREVRKAMDSVQPDVLQPGGWHLPFVGDFDLFGGTPWRDLTTENQIKLSVARCASTSYKTVEGFDMTLSKAIELHDRLVGSKPLHASPCEHQCRADECNFDAGNEGCEGIPFWANADEHGNLTGFIQYRKTLPDECL